MTNPPVTVNFNDLNKRLYNYNQSEPIKVADQRSDAMVGKVAKRAIPEPRRNAKRLSRKSYDYIEIDTSKFIRPPKKISTKITHQKEDLSWVFELTKRRYVANEGHIFNSAIATSSKTSTIFAALHIHGFEHGSQANLSVLDQIKSFFRLHNFEEIGGNTGIGKIQNIIQQIYYAPMAYFVSLLEIKTDLDIRSDFVSQVYNSINLSKNPLVQPKIEKYLSDKGNFIIFRTCLLKLFNTQLKICTNKIRKNQDPSGIFIHRYKVFKVLKTKTLNFSHDDFLKQLASKKAVERRARHLRAIFDR